MSAVTITSSARNAGRFFLRWSDRPDLPVREEPVELIGWDPSEPVIRSAFRVSEDTEVFLIGANCTKNGFVRSCRQEGNCFLLAIQISSEYAMAELLPPYDPGLFAIDDFLTEEEEAKILESLDEGNGDRRQRSDLSVLLLFWMDAIRKAFRWRDLPLQRRTEVLGAFI